MRSLSILALIVGLVAWIGYAFLGDRSGLVTADEAGGAAIAPESVREEIGDDSGQPMDVLASWVGDSKGGDSKSGDSNEPSQGSGKTAYYQWVDERGSVNFAASLDDVPAAWRERAGRIELDSGSFTMTKSASSGVSLRRRPPPSPVVAESPARDVVVYTAPWCGWCQKTLAFLDERGVDYVNKDIEADEEYASELREKTGGTAIPLVEIDGEQIRGFSASRMTELLD